MTWLIVLAVALGTFALRVAGPWLARSRAAGAPSAGTRLLALVPPAMLAGLVAIGTFEAQGRLVLDARVVGVAVALVAIGLRAPMLVVVVVAAASAGLVRWLA